MKFIKISVGLKRIKEELEQELPEGIWGKSTFDKKTDTVELVFGSEEINHPFNFAMTLDEWKEKYAPKQKGGKKRGNTRKVAEPVAAVADEAETETGSTGPETAAQPG